jgi:dinuclear metal center YbgI/SA1388 family protein
MTVRLHEVVSYLDATLEIGQFRDYGLNGLQVEGSPEVDRIVTGVSANMALFERAVELDADLIVVHHGVVWGSGIASVTGTMANRLRLLLQNSISLAAYHLPLDKHERLGNNVGLADAIALQPNRTSFGELRGHALGLSGTWPEALSIEDAVTRIGAGLGAAPRFVFPVGPQQVRRVGLCSGAASDMIEAAAKDGCDLFLTGELAERAGELARELQITLVAGGHYATEVFGARRLVDELKLKFADVQVDFVDIPSPL